MSEPGRVSVIIPARNERHLQKTVENLQARAAGDLEIIVVLDGGPWPDPPLPASVVVLRHNEPRGMRPSINAAAAVATGEFLMKCDGHCLFAEGFDEVLRADCADDWLVVPTRHSVDEATWAPKWRHFNYHYLTFPFATSMYGYGLHAKTYPWDQNKAINAETADVELDDLMSFQGSCWFQKLANFKRLGDLDHANYYFYQEAQEIGLRQWLTGGRCVINKRTFYGHWHKGKTSEGADGRKGRGYYLDLRKKRKSEAFATDFWMNDRHPLATRTFASLIDQFWPWLERIQNPEERWPEDWESARYRHEFETRPPEQVPEHTGP